MAAIPSDDVIRIYGEVMAGEEAPADEPPRWAEFRAGLTREIAAFRENHPDAVLEMPNDNDQIPSE